MYAEVLIVPDCPSSRRRLALRTVLDELEFGDVSVNTTVIDTLQKAQQRGFVGSPMFLINGMDAFGHSPLRVRVPSPCSNSTIAHRVTGQVRRRRWSPTDRPDPILCAPGSLLG